MSKSSKLLICAFAALLASASVLFAQDVASTGSESVKASANGSAISNVVLQRKPDLTPMTLVQASAPTVRSPAAPAAPQPATNAVAAQAASPAKTNPPAGSQPTTSLANPETENGGVGVREFQGDDVGQVLRLLARQAKINMVVSEAVTGTVTMRLEDVTALQAIAIIVKAKGLFMDTIDNVYYIKTAAERTAEPTQSETYQFSYARAKDVAPLLAGQLASKVPPQVDERTNTIFYREGRSNVDAIHKMLVQIDKPTRQVMIEARLVEVTANPKQSYGINWAGVVGGSTTPQTFSLWRVESGHAATRPEHSHQRSGIGQRSKQ